MISYAHIIVHLGTNWFKVKGLVYIARLGWEIKIMSDLSEYGELKLKEAKERLAKNLPNIIKRAEQKESMDEPQNLRSGIHNELELKRSEKEDDE